MAIKYSVETMKVGFGTDKKEAYVGRVQLGETVETDMLVEQVSLRTGMTQAQIKMLLENLTDSIKHFCLLGNGVRIGKLGIIKPAIKTKSAEAADEVEVMKLKFRFIPSSEMHDVLDELTVRKIGESVDEGVVDEGDDEEEEGGTEFT